MKYFIVFILVIFAVFPLNATNYNDTEQCEVRGVRPTDKVSTIEFNPGVDVLDDDAGVSLAYFKMKYYYTFDDRHYNIGVELPLTRYEGYGEGINGLGDTLLSLNYQGQTAPLSYGLQLEFNLPSASKDELGMGRYQVSPAAFLEYAIDGGLFVAGGVKYYKTFLGDKERANVNMLRLRGNIGYVAETDWWFLFDPQYYIDIENTHEAELYTEFEFGFMFRKEVSLYAKPGFHVCGSEKSKDWSFQIGFKLLDLSYI